MADMVNVTIDGNEVSVPKGTTILEAAKRVGTEVPHYCYHPGMSSPAMCRLAWSRLRGAEADARLCNHGYGRAGGSHTVGSGP